MGPTPIGRPRSACGERTTAMNTGADETAASVEDLRSEVEALRVENDRLRGLLGLDERSADAHAQAWAPTLLSEGTARPAVDGSSAQADKVALLRSLFGARTDVYATRWQNSSSGKTGWSPATRGRWSKGRPPKDFLPLTDEVFAAHLRGEEAVGIYPLLRGDTCTLLACDFDKGTWALDALAYLDACPGNAVPAALERSRSGNGAHVWIFFEGPVPASAARAMGAALLRQAMTARAELDLGSYDRFFPSQDFLPKAGFGNLIALSAPRGLRRPGHHGVPRPHDDDTVGGPVGVSLLGRVHDTGRGGGARRDAPTDRHRASAVTS